MSRNIAKSEVISEEVTIEAHEPASWPGKSNAICLIDPRAESGDDDHVVAWPPAAGYRHAVAWLVGHGKTFLPGPACAALAPDSPEFTLVAEAFETFLERRLQ
jgi:hypothetical protein